MAGPFEGLTPAGDLTGDGADDLLAPCGDGFTVLASPHTLPVVPCEGVPLEVDGDATFFTRPEHDPVDLDGDGRPDLLAAETGILKVWYARHLFP